MRIQIEHAVVKLNGSTVKLGRVPEGRVILMELDRKDYGSLPVVDTMSPSHDKVLWVAVDRIYTGCRVKGDSGEKGELRDLLEQMTVAA